MSFLPFCTVCDKQLTGPTNGSVLYCSEKCKRKDARISKRASASYMYSSPINGQSSGLPLTPTSPQLFAMQADTMKSSENLQELGMFDGNLQRSDSAYFGPMSPSLRFNTSFSDIAEASTLKMARGVRPLHPNSVYSSSPRSIELVSPMLISQTPPRYESGSFMTSAPMVSSMSLSASGPSKSKKKETVVPSYNMPLVVEKKTDLASSVESQKQEGSLKRLFYFNDM
ncbi:hypothetical protein V1511DRAFT_505383 [Dipodascopsis uninucleata]